jgi:hypothetical protein
MPIKEIKINLPQGTYETIVFAVDDGLSEIGKIKQLIDDMKDWRNEIPRCNWWITQLKKLLNKRVNAKNGN